MVKVLLEEAPLPGGAVRAVDCDGVEAAGRLGVVVRRIAVGALMCAMGCVEACRAASGYAYGALECRGRRSDSL
jgi:hypothetical protein